MDVRAYIESGILEQYVLGQLSQEERLEVAQNAALYPDIREEINQIELALERFAQLSGKTPPPGTLEGILSKISTDKPAAPVAILSQWMLPALAAALLLSLAGTLYLFWQNQQLSADFNNAQTAQLQCDSLANEYAVLQRELRFLKDVETRPIVMNGTPVAPEAIAAVYFNTNSQRAYLGGLQLPLPPAGKQYQLWAIVEGQPVSMGVFDLPAREGQFIEVPFIANAQAFAISLEDAGGQPQPTVEQIYVVGNVG
ncbi:MAG TPA: anti-sigma factor [Saprospiraceae bacterium]|nr:anti-sigma factor [Saprospiraceae bacterium]HMP25332.1 anti-sigma factor [Saprospiraceae bacterium]